MSRRSRVRLLLDRLPFVILVLAAGALAWVWLLWDRDRQMKVLASMGTVVITLALEGLWVLALSGFRWRTRLVTLLVATVVVGSVVLLVRIDQVTGDLVPILAWRFSPKPDTTLDASVLRAALPVATARDGQADGAGGRSPAWGEWPQFLGPARNGVLTGVRLARDWNARPPRELWRRQVGAGWSGFAVAGDAAFTQEQRGDTEMVTCYDLRSGAPRWAHGASGRYDSVVGGVGPRATPTVTADRVYAFGGLGRLSCIDRYTGEPLWSRDAVAENGGRLNEWGASCSPLVVDGRVVVSVGGDAGRSLVAYDAATGEPLWAGGDDRSGYSSPSLYTLAGVPQILILNDRSIAAHAPRSGEVLWRAEWPGSYPKVAQPVVLPDDRVLVSSGYGVGCALYRIERTADGTILAEQQWKTNRMKAKFSNFVQLGGLVYGLDDGILVCLDPARGQRRWKRGRFGHGQMILVGEVLLLTVETTGEIVLVEPDPAGYRELARFQALDHKLWNSPALAAPYLLLRTDQEAVCYELALEP